MLVDNNGPEVSMVNAVIAARPMALGFTSPGVPGGTVTLNATAASANLSMKLGDAFVYACTAKGHVADASATV